MQQDFDSRRHMELALPNKWWERHFRGYEATLPIFLMKNLAKRFDQLPEEISEEFPAGSRESLYGNVEHRVR